MVDKLARKITAWSVNHSSISAVECKAVQYGVGLAVETIGRLLVLFIIAVFARRGYQMFAFLAVFCTLRTQAGGVHCKSSFGCTCMMFLAGFTAIYLGDIVKISNAVMLFTGLSVLIYIYAPADFENSHDFDRKTKEKMKRNSFFILSANFFIASFASEEIRNTMLIAMSLECISILPACRKIFYREGN